MVELVENRIQNSIQIIKNSEIIGKVQLKEGLIQFKFYKS